MTLNMFSLLLISIPVGLVGSLTGLGGASILIPIMVLFGIPVKEAIASAMVSIIATSSGSAAAYVRERIANVKIAMYLEMFTSVGAIIGATITTLIAPVYLYFFFAAFLMTSFLRLGGRAKPDLLARQSKLSKWLQLEGSYFDEAKKEVVVYKADHPLLGGLGMLVAGLAAGMLGIGAGAFKVTVQENILKLPAKVSSTTSNFIVGMTALAGTSVYLFSGYLNLSLMAPMAIGTTLGAVAGGRVLNRLGDRMLRVLFFFVVVMLIIQMLYKGVSSW
ncbi:MAG: sulfite exporter TauE/SafE family protein [Syntrophorhabdales bacterium]